MTKNHIATNLAYILESIDHIKQVHNIKETIKLIAVSKYSTELDIYEAYKTGLMDFGENKVQDLVNKKKNLQHLLEESNIYNNEAFYRIAWHFIGRLQTNKINMLIDSMPAMIQSLHSIKLAKELQKRLQIRNIRLEALLQINSAKEDSKQGFYPEDAIQSYLQIQQECPNIKLRGLMCIGAHIEDRQQSKFIANSFHTTWKLFDNLKKYGANVLSMGMSNDYEIAIAEGSNCIRIGSQIFKRNK
ncbi:YggS family pyridoxal phosphate-dependent enzyme [Helicobacter muridarum]|uniref:Pyridoxal phosphate homeostasis protein n=1 Tax=Helicobacter muridarum TaxID=216 RepID=A0A099TWD4_9HELI|nr:YggS family pyridoxal phosphate-dependent enzyme [Helicobacter muridarum]TLD99611.1 YggS family pyridoxal phosphate-dependent enzyme [Helicobacter muridarum]STQ86777.1 YggS family pyridoxal phosphate enzyme [Helicobacter muridarum]